MPSLASWVIGTLLLTLGAAILPGDRQLLGVAPMFLQLAWCSVAVALGYVLARDSAFIKPLVGVAAAVAFATVGPSALVLVIGDVAVIGVGPGGFVGMTLGLAVLGAILGALGAALRQLVTRRNGRHREHVA